MTKLILKSLFILLIFSMLKILVKLIFMAVDRISPITIGIIVFIIDLHYLLFFIFSIIFTSKSIIIKEGRTTPKVAKIAPRNPYCS
mgnify:CR=1 FL=1